MSLVTALLVLLVLGVIVAFIRRTDLIDADFKWIMIAVIVIATIVWLLNGFGFSTGPIQVK